SKQTTDEWRSGEIVAPFEGNGMAQVQEHAPGAVLLERLVPGNSLSEMALNGRDEEATDILADVIQRMSARSSSTSQLELPEACPTVHDWARGFERYLATGHQQIPKPLV